MSSALRTIEAQGSRITGLEQQIERVTQRSFATVQQRDIAVLHAKDVIASEVTWATAPFFGDLHCKLVTWLGNDPEKDDTCPCCLELFRFDSQVVQHSPCMNVFHPECIEKWLKEPTNPDTCPICRRSLLEQQAPEEQN